MKPFESHPNPMDPCPKCGEPDTEWIAGYSQWGVIFDQSEAAPRGRLLWKCRTCGYVITTRTKDAR